MPKQITDEIILEVVDHGLRALGESPRKALWYCLEKDFGLCREKVPKNVDSFEEALKSYFGLGYSFLGSLLKNYLSEATGEPFPTNQSFAESVSYLRSKTSRL